MPETSVAVPSNGAVSRDLKLSFCPSAGEPDVFPLKMILPGSGCQVYSHFAFHLLSHCIILEYDPAQSSLLKLNKVVTSVNLMLQ